MVDKKLSQFDEVSNGDVSYFPVLDGNTKNAKIAGTKAMPWTNCITDIPQDIKLSLNNGTLTLVAGSKVYVPNGSGVFNAVNTSSDQTYSNNFNGTFLVFTTTSSIFIRNISNCFSGAPGTIPTFSGTGAWYDTTNNLIKISSDGGSTWTSGTYSLPIAIITISGGSISSIDQVFNGFGYIGSTVFALPGVKGLIPNGRNTDGSLKNIAFEISSVKTFAYNLTGNFKAITNGSEIVFSGDLTYNQDTNINTDFGTVRQYVKLADMKLSSGVISNFSPVGQFACTDYSEFKAAKDDMMTLSTSQTVSGNKKHTGENIFYGGGRCRFWQTSIDISTIPATIQYGGAIQLKDKNGQDVGYIDSAQFTQGQIYARLGVVMNTSGGAKIYPYLNVCGSLSGSQWVEAPTPSSVEDNSNKVITTQWFNNKIKVVSALPANPVNGVFYFITD